MGQIIKAGRVKRTQNGLDRWQEFTSRRTYEEAQAARTLMLGYLLADASDEQIASGIKFITEVFNADDI